MIVVIKTERDFSRMCTNRGFARLAPRFYARCIGDGIYQTIYTGFREYLDPHSPNYSERSRKSYYISIGLRSMYTHYPEDVFAPGRNPGGYRPLDFLKRAKSKVPFNGIDVEYQIMEEVGFDVLDRISTQESLLEWWEAVQTVASGDRVHTLHLVAPFLLCERIADAETEIRISHAHCMSALQSYRNRVDQGYIQRDYTYEQRVSKKADKEMHLWTCLNERNFDELNSYMRDNYLRNIAWIRKYGIPMTQHTPLSIFR